MFRNSSCECPSCASLQVPQGFATTAHAFRAFLDAGRIRERLIDILAGLNIDDVNALRAAGREARQLILATPFPPVIVSRLIEGRAQPMTTLPNPNPQPVTRKFYPITTPIPTHRVTQALEAAIVDAYLALCRSCDRAPSEMDVAVRSSATAEDLPNASFAGQQETYLNVRGVPELLLSVKKCFASLYTDRAISYRTIQGFAHDQVALRWVVGMGHACRRVRV